MCYHPHRSKYCWYFFGISPIFLPTKKTPKCRGGRYSFFSGLLNFTLDPYLIYLSAKQRGMKYHFWVFGMTRPGIEPRPPGPLANTLTIMPIISNLSEISLKHLRFCPNHDHNLTFSRPFQWHPFRIPVVP